MSANNFETRINGRVSVSMLGNGDIKKEHVDHQESVTRNIYTKKGSRLGLRFTVYHRLSLAVIIPNAAHIILHAIEGRLFDAPSIALNAVATNLAAAVLIRQDHFINLLFTTFGLIPHRVPLYIRKHAARLYHFGGIHSGAGVASGIWFVIFNVAALRAYHPPRPDTKIIATMTLCMVMDILLLQMLIFSIPSFRSRFHNLWEQMHRFSGWLLLISFWAFLATYNHFDAKTSNVPLAELYYSTPSFYLLCITTISIIIPWLYLRKVTPRVERLSDHATRLHFDYATVGPCKTPRFSTSPLREWHSFASVPNYYSKGFSIIVSRAGDWTSEIVDNTPPTLWTRGFPALGVLYMGKMFRKILCVGTGSGIAPILGLLLIPGTDFRVLWAAPDPGHCFGADIVRRILKADSRAVMWDTRRDGRPKLVDEAERIYRADSDIEAVFVISNAEVTAEVVFGLEARNVPAYGPIFDS